MAETSKSSDLVKTMTFSAQDLIDIALSNNHKINQDASLERQTQDASDFLDAYLGKLLGDAIRRQVGIRASAAARAAAQSAAQAAVAAVDDPAVVTADAIAVPG